MKFIFLILLFSLCVQNVHAQEGFVFKEGFNEERIAFEQHSNLIVIPVKINDVDLNFYLDTGSTRNVIFNLKGIDSLNIKQGNYIKISGYGEKESIEAYESRGNQIKVGKHIVNTDAEILVLSDGKIDLSPKLDITVNGVLGIEFLKNFVTFFDYENGYLNMYDNFKRLPLFLRNAKQFDLNFYNNRPFVNVELNNNFFKGSYNLLIDTGSGDALWILNELDKNTKIENSFEDYLGFGINGEIYGQRTKVNSIKLFDKVLNKVAVSYPYKEYYKVNRATTIHDGSLGGEILRRFNVVMDSPNKRIIALPNKSFDEGFYYNMSGLGVKKGEAELFTEIIRDFKRKEDGRLNNSSSQVTVSSISKMTYKYIPKIYIDYVREDSPGYLAGIEIGDQVLSINNYGQEKLTLNIVNDLFYKNPYKSLKIKLKRDEEIFKVKFKNIPLVK